MGFWDSLFGGADQPYPSAPGGSPSTPPSYGTIYNAPDPSGFFNRLFAPKQLVYPSASAYQPLTGPKPPVQALAVLPVQAAAPAGAQAPTAQTAGQAAPVAFLVMAAPQPANGAVVAGTPAQAVQSAPGVAPQAASASGNLTQSATASQPQSAQPSTAAPSASGAIVAGSGGDFLPCEPCPQRPNKTLRAYVFNPEFTSCIGTAQGDYLSKELGDDTDTDSDDDCDSMSDDLASALSSRMVSNDGSPVAFVVPDGCDSVDLLYGPVEANPGCGSDDDLDQLVMVGGAKLDANPCGIDGPLTPGDQIIVTVPWRAASWVDMPANRLRVQVIANFYQSQPVWTPFSNS